MFIHRGWLLRVVEPIVGCSEVVETRLDVAVLEIRLTRLSFVWTWRWNTSTVWAPYLGASAVSFVLVIFCKAQCVILYILAVLDVCTTNCAAIAAGRSGTMTGILSTVLESRRLSSSCLPRGRMWEYLPFVRNTAIVYLHRPVPLTMLYVLPIVFCWLPRPRSSSTTAVRSLIDSMVISSMPLPSPNLQCWPSYAFFRLPVKVFLTHLVATVVLSFASSTWLQGRHPWFLWRKSLAYVPF